MSAARRSGMAGALAACLLLGASPATAVTTTMRPPDPALLAPVGSPTTASRAATPPLAGVSIAIDPGHQLGNRNFPREISRLVPAGGFYKACNTTGTSTDAGYPEATFVFQVARRVQARLQALGATVHLTRTRNAEDLWGPCVNTRGAFGRKVGARLMVSLHGDGAPATDYGFHVIVPQARAPWTAGIAAPSLRLAKALRGALDARGLPRSTYIGGGTALSVRSDLGTLNLSDVPVAMIELGNMRNASDARRMTSSTGQAAYALGVVRGIRRFLGR